MATRTHPSHASFIKDNQQAVLGSHMQLVYGDRRLDMVHTVYMGRPFWVDVNTGETLTRNQIITRHVAFERPAGSAPMDAIVVELPIEYLISPPSKA